MEGIFIAYVFILGLLVGSFVNVIALRYNTGMTITTGRSLCFHCGKTLKWYDLIPLVSFVVLLGRCRFCRTKLSWQYPIVELLTGILFVGIFLRQVGLWSLWSLSPHGFLYSVLFFLYYAAIISILLAITVYDLRHMIIPDGLVYTFIVLAVGKLLLFIGLSGFPLSFVNILNLLAPLLLPLPFALLWYVSDGRWIGFGDVKLMAGIGALVGFALGLSAIILAFWIGAVWGVLLIIFSRVKKKKGSWKLKSELPFGPFLILATFIVFFFHTDIVGINQFIALLFN